MINLTPKNRIYFIDEIRGVFIILIVLYHMFYDISNYTTINSSFFYSDLMNNIQPILAGTFVFVSGASSVFSSSNLLRGMKTLGLSVMITIITIIAVPESPIYFGILHLLAICMLLSHGINRWYSKNFNKVSIGFKLIFMLLLIGCFIFTKEYLDLITTNREIGAISILLMPFGVLWKNFSSIDYFPIIPWIFLFFAGYIFGTFEHEGIYPKWFYRCHSKILCTIGSKTIYIYLIHQPVLLFFFWTVSLW